MKNISKLIISILICEGVGIVGSVFTIRSVNNWYAHLNKPFFSPPNWLFGPVWIILYLLMGIAVYMIWSFENPQHKGLNQEYVGFALILFWIHLFFNAIWSVLFFGLHNIFLAFIDIIIIWSLIIFLIWNFAKIKKSAAWLLTPYLLWVSFATVLNFSLLLLN